MFRRRRLPDSSRAGTSERRPSGPSDGVRQIELDYPVNPRPRFGHGLPPHPQITEILGRNRDRYRARLSQIVELGPYLQNIPLHGAESTDEPCWSNGFLPGLDGAALYSLLVHEGPATYLEVGSGNSTRFARRAIRDHGLETKIVSIDPQPRAEIDAICDEVIRSPFEDADLSVLARLKAGDLLFVDNSHRVFTNSDVTVVFLEVLPNLPAGVFVHIHDVFLPEDYPSEWNDRFYSEQYMLAAYLLGGSHAFRTEFPAWYIANDPELSAIVAQLFENSSMAGAERHGNSYWVVTA
jgi:Methyltransferase domain